MKSNTRTLLAIGLSAFALLLLVSLVAGCTTAEVVAGAAVGAVAVVDQLLASGKITSVQHAALIEALTGGMSTEAIIALSVAATKVLDGVIAGGKALKNKNTKTKKENIL